MSGQSIPNPKAIVAMTTLSGEFDVMNDFIILIFTPTSVHDENVSTNQNLNRYRASEGYI